MDLKIIPDLIQKQSESMKYNEEAIDIFEGNLHPYICKLLKDQLSIQSYIQAEKRMAPINILPKVIDKLTNIYQTAVIREPIEDSESDQKLIEYYEKQTKMNSQMNCANELFNLCSTTLIQPYAYNGKPNLRAIPNDKFIVYSENPVEPNKPTHVILIYKRPNGDVRYWVYSDNEIFIVDSNGQVDSKLMAANNLEGLNPIGKIPFVYVNSSKYKLIPTPDCDGLKIVKLLPVMLTDLNQAAMFQAFSILYTIDAGVASPIYAPNAVWEFNSNPASTQKPEIGQIKPQVDYDQVLNLIQSELSMWLGTKGIRSSSIDGLTKDNFSSGISKVIDEMDTFEARQKQVTYFTFAEHDYWDLIINYLHPYWLSNKLIENVGMFSTGCEIATTFAVQLPMQTRGQVVLDLKAEYESGFISRKMAIQKLNPTMTEHEVDELILEIDQERTINNGVAENQPGNTNGPESSGTPPVS